MVHHLQFSGNPSGNGQRERALSEGKRTPSAAISSILNEKPRLIGCDRMAGCYWRQSMAQGKGRGRTGSGIQLIQRAYRFAEGEFEGKMRKDGETPLFVHSTRLAAMAAELGADSNLIAGLLLHDILEDCGVPPSVLGQADFGGQVLGVVLLLTKPKMGVVETGEYAGTRVWVHAIDDPDRWERTADRFEPAEYEPRLNAHIRHILDNCVASAQVKVRAFIGKMLDGLDSLVSDQHLEPVRAGIRQVAIIGFARHLEVLAPGLHGILLEVLREKRYDLPGERSARPKASESVVELQPPTNLNVAYLDRLPAPNGSILVYAKDEQLQARLRRGGYRGRIRVELPHDAPRDSAGILASFFENRMGWLRFEPGNSLLPWASEGAGRVVWVSGIRNKRGYGRFLVELGRFHPYLHRLMDEEKAK